MYFCKENMVRLWEEVATMYTVAYSCFARRTDRQRTGDEVQSTHDDEGRSRFADEGNELDARDFPQNQFIYIT